jgi:[acyl-carrier-protein] S-malonyltransferase
MADVAFVFPGQGAQKVGMGKAAYDDTEAGKQTFAAADAALGESLSGLCFEGPEDRLMLTANSQPAILTTSIALLRGLGERCDATAGHSLGEYSANVAAGSLAFETAVRLVRQRGLFMQEAVPVGQGAMAAVLGGDVGAIEKACAEADGLVEPVNYNCPGQLVIAGEKAAVERASKLIADVGGKVRALPVSAPFHCQMMKPAEDKFRAPLSAAEFSQPKVPIYVNVDAVKVDSAAAARDALTRQISRPVRWEQSARRMLEDGVRLFVEIGPGRALAGMIKRIDKSAVCVNVESPADFAAARAAIAAQRG